MSQSPPQIEITMVAGEASGDLLASLLLKGLREQGVDWQGSGVGAEHMAAQGFRADWPSSKLSVRGYVEVLRHYRSLVALRRQLGDRWLAERPDVFVGVDAPDFNLELAKRLRVQGVRTMHFVCPSIWAWRAERVKLIKEAVDHVLCIFPFEVDLLERHGIAATYVGHPIAQVMPLQPDAAAARSALNINEAGDGVIAIMPGSREPEVVHLLPRFLRAAALMLKKRPELKFILPAVPALRERIDALVASHGKGLPLQIVAGQSHLCMTAADVVLVASGTATLEVALAKRPMVVAYHMATLSWWIHQRKRLQPWVALPNILAEKFLVPELLQGDAKPERLAHEVLAWLDDGARVESLQQELVSMHQSLMADTASLSARALREVLDA